MAIAEAPQTSQRQDEVLEYSIMEEFPSWKLIPLWVILAEAVIQSLLTTDSRQAFSLQALFPLLNHLFLDLLILSSIPGIWSWISGSSHRQRQKINSILGTEWESAAPFYTKSPDRLGFSSDFQRLYLGGGLILLGSKLILDRFNVRPTLEEFVLLLISSFLAVAWFQWRREQLRILNSGLLWERSLTICFIPWSVIEKAVWRQGVVHSRLLLEMTTSSPPKSESREIGFPNLSDAERDRMFDLLERHVSLKR